MTGTHEITRWLGRLSDGNDGALERVVQLLYDELRTMARSHLRNERAGHTLSNTALVNELYLKLAQHQTIRAHDRVQFFKIAATTMRRLLVDYARTKRRQKRGQGDTPIPLDEVEAFLADDEAQEILAIDEALRRLSVIHPRGAEVVQQRFYVGLSLEETADLLGVSTKTVQRDWITARAWLRKEVSTDLEFD